MPQFTSWVGGSITQCFSKLGSYQLSCHKRCAHMQWNSTCTIFLFNRSKGHGSGCTTALSGMHHYLYRVFCLTPGLYPYFFNHPGQISQLSDVCVSHTWFQPCLAVIQIMLVKLQCIIPSISVATEHFHVGWKTAWQNFKSYSDNIREICGSR